MPLTISDLMSKMPGAFLPEKAVGLGCGDPIQVYGRRRLEDWFATFKDGKCTVAQGDAPSPKMTLTADSSRLSKDFHWRIGWHASFYAGQAQTGWRLEPRHEIDADVQSTIAQKVIVKWSRDDDFSFVILY